LRFARAIRGIVLCCLLLGGCAETGGEATPKGYVVRAHDTLYSIAWRHDLDYRDLARWNNIAPDYRISVGQYLVLSSGPNSSNRNGVSKVGGGSTSGGGGARSANAPTSAARPATPRTAAPATNASQTTSVAGAPSASGATGSPTQAGVSLTAGQGGSATRTQAPAQKWIWPTQVAGGPIAVPGGGVLLGGRLGQDVRAASGGRVVYTGSGLRGYGNLIIIKHGESLLSAYAHTREMLVREGQDVAAGQVIAHMGEGRVGDGARQAGVLYFEIRQNGRPIDPLPFFNALPDEAIPSAK
jgi:lipoprotein NlpD